MKDLNYTLIFEATHVPSNALEKGLAFWKGSSKMSKTMYWLFEHAPLSHKKPYEEILALQEKVFELRWWQEAFLVGRKIDNTTTTKVRK